MSKLRDALQAAVDLQRATIRKFHRDDIPDGFYEVRNILEAAITTPEWRPMGTAPKDGTEIRHRISYKTRWANPGYWNNSPHDVIQEWQPLPEPPE